MMLIDSGSVPPALTVKGAVKQPQERVIRCQPDTEDDEERAAKHRPRHFPLWYPSCGIVGRLRAKKKMIGNAHLKGNPHGTAPQKAITSS